MAIYNYINHTGVIVVDTEEIKSQVINDFKTAFGDNINTDPSTPSGLLIAKEVELRSFVARYNAEIANQINPDLATDVFLDALTQLTSFNGRRGAIKSFLSGVNFNGNAGILISSGYSLDDINGNKWVLVDDVTIQNNGVGIGSFEAENYGAILCAAHELDTLKTNILGVQSIVNPFASTQGRLKESDPSLRRRRRELLANQSTSTPDAIKAHLSELGSVHSYQFLENYSDVPATIRGITLKPKSIWVCVYGGTDEEIANALYVSKTAGAGYNGQIEFNIKDELSQVDYPILFDRAQVVNVSVLVTIRPINIDAERIIKNIILNYANGDLNDDDAFSVGIDISPWEIAGAINQQEPRISVLKVELSKDGMNYSTDVMQIQLNEIAVTTESSIRVVDNG